LGGFKLAVQISSVGTDLNFEAWQHFYDPSTFLTIAPFRE